MDSDKLVQLAEQGYNRVPIIKTLLADLDTPLSTYLKLANQPFTFLFESFQGGEQWGRYSILGLPCEQLIQVFGQRIERLHQGNLVETITTDDPLAWIEQFHQQFKVAELTDLPTFNGGLVGYFGYDTIRYIEPKLGQCQLADPLQTPDILLMVCDEFIIFDNLTNQLHIVHYIDPAQAQAYSHAQARLAELAQILRQTPLSAVAKTGSNVIQESDFESNMSQAEFEKNVDKVKQYILDGDVMQVVFSQRLRIPFTAPPLELYRALRHLNPSPYLYYLNLGEFHIVGASPEILVRLHHDEVTVRPLAGTRPRGKTATEDAALAAELLADPKELAEHLMLIDLGRNDVGRIAQTESVTVTEKMQIERYSHVMHIVSNVTAKLTENLTAIDVLRATLPAGTLSGAPKVRAMEIIDEIENEKRGIYGGAVGYWAYNGNMDVAIAIRTAVIKQQQLYIRAGAGLVADSVPRTEWEETMNKGRAIFRAVALVEENALL